MASSSLFRQTGTFKMVQIQTHIKTKRIPPKLWKHIERQRKDIEKSFNHTVNFIDYKSTKKQRSNSMDDQYEIDEKSLNAAADYNALIVGSSNYNHQFPHLAHSNLMKIFGFMNRRIPKKEWEIPRSVCSEFKQNIFTPNHFKNASKTAKKCNFERDKSMNHSMSHLKDGLDTNNIPYFVCNDNGISLMIYRNISKNIKTTKHIQRIIDEFEPNSIITQCNADNFKNIHSVKNTLNSLLQCVVPPIGNLNMCALKKSENPMYGILNATKSETNIICSNLCKEYDEMFKKYSFLCDLFSMSAIEISPILENKILPKKMSTISTKLLKEHSTLNERIKYLLYPYFKPHSFMLGQIQNFYALHCLFGCVNELKSKRILMIVDDENVNDLVTKLQSKHFKYSYDALFKKVDDEFVTMPSVLPFDHLMDTALKLDESEWKILHKMFGMKFVQFLESEMERKQALVVN